MGTGYNSRYSDRHQLRENPLSVVLTYPLRNQGRGSFPLSGTGGTINGAGDKPGRFYRAPGSGAPKDLLMPGLIGFRAHRDNAECSINHYAVYRAVMFLQASFGEKVDGILGPKTDAKVKAWQERQGLKADGIYGPASARRLLTPLVERSAQIVHPEWASDLAKIMRGTVSYESGWDHGAVGIQDPRDIGIAQAHLPVHPNLSVDDALDPQRALAWMARFIDYNLDAMKHNVEDAVAAYNLGVGGARTWIEAGRPQFWTPVGSTTERDMHKYVQTILGDAS